MNGMITRRAFMGGLAAASAAGLIAPFGALASEAVNELELLPSLRKVAETKGVYFGTAASPKVLSKDFAYRKAVSRECNLLVPENATKWAYLQPQRGKWDFTGADKLLSFAEENGIKMRGHTLLWYRGFPQWAEDDLKAGKGEALLEEHIHTVVSRYRGKFMSWDVVNEAIEPNDGLANGLRKSPWLAVFGPTYIDRAFQYAAEADPNCQLVYNDWGQESYGKRPEAILNLLRRLKDRGVPVHGVGIQAHLSTRWNFGPQQVTSFCRQVADMGLEVLITELDVSDAKLADDLVQRDEATAERMRIFLEAVSESVKPKQILTWGLSDRYSWLQESNSENPTGRAVRTLPLDRNYKRKAMWKVLHDYFRQLS